MRSYESYEWYCLRGQLHFSTISAFCSRQGAKYSIIFMANPINFLSSRVQRKAIFSVPEDSISECGSCYMVSLNKQRQDKLETFLAHIGARHRFKRAPHSACTHTRTRTQSLPVFTFSLSLCLSRVKCRLPSCD